MEEKEEFLYKKLNIINDLEQLNELPEIIKAGLEKNITLRDYQEEAFRYFVTYFENEKLRKNKQIHTLFHMATGSGKTVIMAGLILYLYTKKYRKFLFFVNQTNILEKTKENFINSLSSKYLFNNELEYLGERIKIEMVDNFSFSDTNNIEICFISTQKLHNDLMNPRENSLTFNDFEDNKIVFISDESHHVNTLTKAKDEDKKNLHSWEFSVLKALGKNVDNIMLEFTATVDLKDKNVVNKYKDKIIYNYPLLEFRKSGYTKDFQNFATDTNIFERILIALILSEYRKYLFADQRVNIKPVVLLKSQYIKDSEEHYKIFFKEIEKLKKESIKKLYNIEEPLFVTALEYFREKDDSFELLIKSIQTSFSKDNTMILNSEIVQREEQLLLNSLEDKDNPIRLIFTVDMLNEGWDVLNLYDIVRLYETRQGGSKISNYTIKEAQLIGRGARYCPFQFNEEQEKYKRKYDNDLENDNRILETMLFHSKNDSKYISELRKALVHTGMQDEEPIKLEYRVKDDFKETDFYKNSLVYSNKRIPKERTEVKELEGTLRTKTYRYSVRSAKAVVVELMPNVEKDSMLNVDTKHTDVIAIKFKEIDYNILEGMTEKFNELKFNVVKSKYPNIKSMREFLTSEEYLGNSTIEISYDENYTGKDMTEAIRKAFSEISSHIISIKPEYQGTKEFEPKELRTILKDKVISLSRIDKNGGIGASQNENPNENYRLNLKEEDWYVFNDNFGTSEEKLFLKYFKSTIEPKLRDKGLEFYVVRNERISDLAIYSFEDGERLEPDFLLFIRKKTIDSYESNQIYIEPKGNHLLVEEKWKEDFLLSLKENAYTNKMFDYGNKYKIIGLPFFNELYKKEEFESHINRVIEEL